MSTVKEEIERQRAWREADLYTRQQNFKKILKLAKALLPMDYQAFVYRVAYYLNLSYLQNEKRGVYMRELDILIGIGKLCKSQDGMLSLPQ
jgi:hypothetical protein